MAFDNKEEFLDALYEHMDLEDDDEDQSWFADKVEKFFDQFTSDNNSGNGSKRRRGNSGNANKPRRKRRENNSSGQGTNTYGSGLFFK